jgi:hypothetical protein
MAVASVLVVAVAVAVTHPHQAAGAAEASRDVSRFACPATATDAFGDDDGSVHEAAIDCLVGYGFINGTSATTFSPNGRVTRGQFASFVARLLAFAGARMDNTHAGFGDTGESVHYDAINAVANFGIVQGITPERFAPDAPLTRAQAASNVQIRTGDRPNGALRAQLQPVEPSSTTRFATDIRSAAPRAAV